MKKCSKCGKENLDNAKYCISCGETLEEYNVRCPRCSFISKGNAKICEKCGYRFINLNDYETKSFEMIDDTIKLNEENYKEEEKQIKQKVLNSKIKDISKDKLSTTISDEIFEYNEDFVSSESRFSAQKMMKIERKFHQVDFFVSLILIILALAISFLPLVSLNSSKNVISDFNFTNIIILNWKNIIKEFGFGIDYFGNALAYSYGPILQFVFYLLFFFYSFASFIYILVKGIKDIKRNYFKHNFYLVILPSDIFFLFLLSYIGFNENVNMISGYSIVFLLLINLYLVLVAIYNIFKASVVKNKTIVIRRSLLSISFLLGIISLAISLSKIIVYDDINVSIYTYLGNLLVNLNENNNLTSFYLGFIAFFLYSLNIFFIGVTSYYSYKMLKLYNHFKITTFLFSLFSSILSLLSSILFTVSTYYSNLEYEANLTLAPIFNSIFSLIIFFISLIVLVIFKDNVKINRGKKENGK